MTDFDINKVKVLWDFAPNDNPCVLFAYADNGKVWIIGKCDTDTGVIGTDELRKMWEKATNPNAIREYAERIKRWIKEVSGE